MVFIAPLVGAAVFLSGLTAALPARRDNSYSGSSNSNSYGGSSDSNSYGGSSDSNSYGGSSDSNSYGGSSSNNNYGGSSNNYGGNNNQYTTSSTSSYESTSTQGNNYGGGYGGGNNYYTTSSSENNNYYTTSSTEDIQSTSTTSSYNSYQTSNYGSGSSNWGGNGYQDCVNQCVAQYGGMTGGGSYQATATSGSYGSSGNGATHTVIVAPTKGVFRFMPFAVTNASVGDTIEFHWGADNHTVTKSSELLPCNKSADAPVFASGEQNKDFVFRQVVNDTNPTFYYCGTPTHCEKGMFGIINPQMATPGSPTSLGGMMSSMAANDSDLSAYAAYSQNVTTNNDVASAWGTNFEMANMPDWSKSLMATNVLFTRAAFAMNPDTLNADGSSNLASVASTPLMIPMDISGALNAAAAPSTPAANTPVANAADPAATTGAPAPSTSAKPSSAMALASPKMLVGVVVVLATIFAL